MIETNQTSAGKGSGNASDFRHVFIARVHEVTEGGYRRLRPEEFVKEEEPAITGELRKAMNCFLRDVSAPAWADYFSVHDDPPIDDDIRKGKRRRRIDIRVDSSTPRPGDSYSFEAKRLARGFTVAKYLGEEGLGSFLCGEYARDDNDAGMLGYIQDHDTIYWSGEIEAAITQDRAANGDPGKSSWRQISFPRGPESLFVSTHPRAAVGRPITVYHTLLLFCQSELLKK